MSGSTAGRIRLWGAISGAVFAITAAAAVSFTSLPAAAAGEYWELPRATLDVPNTAEREVAILAGGCFWGVQGVYQRVEGVLSAVSGYAGGEAQTAHYYEVGTGRTGHAEAVEVVFDPRVISYAEILRIFFSVVHDPTQLDRQGPDWGSEYRSHIYTTSDTQRQVAAAYVAELGAANIYGAPIVTRIDDEVPFYPAEGYHQDYLILNPSQPYIVINDLPKVANLLRLFPDYWRDTPVTVAATRPDLL